MNMEKRIKHHYIYKTTCSVTGRYYLGMHSTYDLDDGYIGSGKILNYSIRKYGRAVHVCEIPEHLQSRHLLQAREAELINAEVLLDPKCMNLKLGGAGGWDHVSCDTEQHSKSASCGGRKGIKTFWDITRSDPKKLDEFKARSSRRMKKMHSSGLIVYDTFSGKKHSPDTIEKMKTSKIGHGIGLSNSQYGTVWIHSMDLKICKKIKKELLSEYTDAGWIVGRKMKF